MKLVAHRDPSLARANTAPKPRKEVWAEGEVVRLVKTAWRQGYYGLATLIAIGYDTAFSPVDARRLVAGEMRTDGKRIWFQVHRLKTGRDAVGTLTQRSERLLRAYLKWLDVERPAEAPIFRTRGGKPVSRPGRAGERGGDRGGGASWAPRPYTKDKERSLRKRSSTACRSLAPRARAERRRGRGAATGCACLARCR
jgi:hypothetical protein